MSDASDFRAVHIGDLHYGFVSSRPLDYLGKRILGVTNFFVNRRKRFRVDHVPAMVQRVLDLEPATVLFSGDAATTSLPEEFEAAREGLRPLAEQARLRAVPGNHDRYTRRELRERTFDRVLLGGRVDWPITEQLTDGLWMIALDGTTDNGMKPHGAFRPESIHALNTWWSLHRESVRAVWVLCHFPAEEPEGALPHTRGPQLLGCEPLLEFLRGIAVPKLFLHGHHHYRWVFASATVPGLVYLNAGSPTLSREGPPPDLGFYQLDWDGAQTRVRLHRRDPATLGWRGRDVAMPAPGRWESLQGAF